MTAAAPLSQNAIHYMHATAYPLSLYRWHAHILKNIHINSPQTISYRLFSKILRSKDITLPMHAT